LRVSVFRYTVGSALSFVVRVPDPGRMRPDSTRGGRGGRDLGQARWRL
jgi:hypothetical protein